ncbi:MAG: hypothetical protein PWP14_2378 [Methanolobus sp.]|nr:hypothetical protein [Methanolobus sp.]MDN5310984.1 hypothetical protein [Methanolobus sp.]
MLAIPNIFTRIRHSAPHEHGAQKAYLELISGSVIFGMLGLFVDRLEAVPTLWLIFYKQSSA